MNFTKTRIWGSPLVAPPTTNEDGQHREHATSERSDAPAAVDLTKTVVSPPPSLAQTVVTPAPPEPARISPRSGTRIMNLATLMPSMRRTSGLGAKVVPDLSDEPVRAPTRVLPIEQLASTTFAPAEHNFEPPPDPSDSQLSPALKAKFALSPIRIVTICVAALCIVMWVIGSFREPPQAARKPAAARGPAVPAAMQAVARGTVEVAVNPERPLEPATLPAADALSDPLARTAVDALAHGDESGAQALYTKLAALHPEQPVYAEAARILRLRLRDTR